MRPIATNEGHEALSCASCDLIAAHNLPMNPEPHQHIWEVTIYWPSEPWIDALEMRDRLSGHLQPSQGQFLPGLTQERLALSALNIPDVVRVQVWRALDRIGCEVSK